MSRIKLCGLLATNQIMRGCEKYIYCRKMKYLYVIFKKKNTKNGTNVFNMSKPDLSFVLEKINFVRLLSF